MMKTKTWKSVGAVLLTLSMLAGMLSIIGVIPGAAKTTTAMKFQADFGDLSAIVTGNEGAFTDGAYSVGYTPSADTTSRDGKINTWMAKRFALYSSKLYARRTWMGQSSASLQSYYDDWSKNTYFRVAENGALQYITEIESDQMLRKADMLTVQHDGEHARLKNFEAELCFTRASANTQKSAVIVSFHETQPGLMSQWNGDYQVKRSGNTVVLGNGTGSGLPAGNDGLVFWPASEDASTMSATTIDSAVNPHVADNEVKTGDGVRFENSLTSGEFYTLKVRVVNGKVAITLTDAAGDTVYTVDKTCTTTEGYLSFGFSNANFLAKSFTVTELDDNGKLVDFGTNTVAKHDGVEVFDVNFDEQLPDATWNNGEYYYDADHNAEVFVTDTHRVMRQPDFEAVDANNAKINAHGYYTINTQDTALVDYLENKFDFFYAQEGTLFQRPNVSGYVVTDSGEERTGYIADNWNAQLPDARKTDGTWTWAGEWLDGIGPQATWQNGIAKPSLYNGAYLTGMNDVYGRGGADSIYRKSFIMRVQGADGKPALLHNFKLEMTFQLRDTRDWWQDFLNASVSFRSTTPFARQQTFGSLFALSPNGGYFLGDDYTITNGVKFDGSGSATNTRTYGDGNNGYYTDDTSTIECFTHDSYNRDGCRWQGAASGVISGDHHLTLTVVGNTVRAVVTDMEGNVKLDVTDNSIEDTYGYLFIGDSNNAAFFKNIRVTRLSDDSTPDHLIPVDFNNTTADHTFSANFTGTLERKNWDYFKTTGVKGAGMPWLKQVDMPYAFGADDAFSAELAEKFNFYLDKESNIYQLDNPYDNSHAYDDDADSNYFVQWKLTDERTLSAIFPVTQGEMFRKSMTMVPKLNGKEIVAKDVETEFDVNLPSNTTRAAVGLGFRSQDSGHWASNFIEVNANRGMILLNKAGIYIADSATLSTLPGLWGRHAAGVYFTPFKDTADPGWTGGSNSYPKASTDWNDGATVTNAHVYVRLVGSDLTVKVTSPDRKTTYFDNSANPYKVSNDAPGVMEYAVIGGTCGLANISLDVLNENGEAVSADAVLPVSASEAVFSDQGGLLGYDSSEEWGQHDGWNKYPNGNPYCTPGEWPKYYTEKANAAATAEEKAQYNAKAKEVADRLAAEFNDYYNARFDFYYNNLSDYRKHLASENIGIKGAAYTAAIYANRWLQFGNIDDGPASTELVRFNSLVPKKDGKLLFGQDISARVDFRYNYGDAAAIIGFRMGEPGKYVDADGKVLEDVSFVRISKNDGIWLYEGTKEPKQISAETFTDSEVIVLLNVKGDKLTVAVKNSDGSKLLASATDVTLAKAAQPGYAAATFAANRMDLGRIEFTVNGTAPIVDVAKNMAEGTLRVTPADSDKTGYYKYLVEAVPDADCQMKTGSLTATNGAKIELMREGFRKDMNSNVFALYTKNDTTVSAEFFTPHTANDLDLRIIGTSTNADLGGLRFISRMVIDHDEAGNATANVDGKKVAVDDYGVLVAVQSALAENEELTVDSKNQYVAKRSAKELNTYFDYSSNYIDISVQVTGLNNDAYQALPIVSRGYLKLADGTVLYTDAKTCSYNNG